MDGGSQEEAEQDARRQAGGQLEGEAARLLGMPTVSPGQASAPGLWELWLLRRPAGHRGRVTA
jgi:hypothetical protein